MNTESLTQFFQRFFEQRGVILPEQLAEYDFIAAGVLDSFEILTMIMALETEFGISIPATLLAESKNAQLGSLVTSLLELM